MIYTKRPKGFPRKTKIVSGAMIFSETESLLLLLRRSEDKKYCTAGGKKKSKETPVQTMLREVKEETRIKLKKNEMYEYFRWYIVQKYSSFIFNLFWVRVKETPKVVIDKKEHDKFVWVTYKKAIKNPKLIQDQRKCMETSRPDWIT